MALDTLAWFIEAINKTFSTWREGRHEQRLRWIGRAAYLAEASK
jgi:hypothetical protein